MLFCPTNLLDNFRQCPVETLTFEDKYDFTFFDSLLELRIYVATTAIMLGKSF